MCTFLRDRHASGLQTHPSAAVERVVEIEGGIARAGGVVLCHSRVLRGETQHVTEMSSVSLGMLMQSHC